MREKILSLIEKKDFTSGEYIAKNLNISRTSVWKHIKSLEKLGYTFESKKNKGYRLISRPDKPIPEELSINLKTDIIGKKIHYFEKITSTNHIAKKLIEKKVTEGTIVISDIQTKGRGRKNRDWSSPKGGLWFSVILYPNIPPEKGMLITMTFSVAIAKSIEDLMGIKCVIKWPNDLLIDGKKVCGVLTELDAEIDQINNAIVGIGINVNNKIEPSLKDVAISIKQKIGSDISRVKLLGSILENLDKEYLKLVNNDFESIRKKWFSYSNIIGRKICVNQEDNIFKGVVKNIDSSGCIILDAGKDIVRVVSGDIKYI